ncbi:MAG: NrfD/PsrC family molybdoenzyme membrane anchor subunit [Bacillota bacterium]
MQTQLSIPTDTTLPAIDNTFDDPTQRAPLVLKKDFSAVTETVSDIAFRKPPLGWYIAFGISLSLLGLLGICIIYLFTTGVGVWGNNQPVGWAFDIVNFVFWVGIGHAGTLISAILFLLRQNWRTSINRFAEAMTIFAVICAGMFPAIHVGRPWLAYWLFPIPNQMGMWPQFRSPLLWDVFAVSTYATVSLLFWYTGMVPDLATLRDRAKGRVRQIIYGILSLGWNGSSRHWHRFERAYLLLAALATPLVLSVHSVVSFDFATAQLPGWHATIFPPYFVAGAVFGGFAMVITLAIPARQFFGLKDIITLRHLENMNKILLATSLMVGYSYATEIFTAWYSGSMYERFTFLNRAFGPYAWAYWIMVSCNVIAPQFLWSKKVRTSLWAMMLVALCVDVGMWFERFVIIVTSLTRDFLPSSWGVYKPTLVDLGMLAGSFGLFFTLFLLFCRFLPMVAMAEVKTVMPQAHSHSGVHGESTRDEKKSDYWPDEAGRVQNGAVAIDPSAQARSDA